LSTSLGSLICLITIDKIGRLTPTLICGFLLVSLSFLSAVSQDVYFFFAIRGLYYISLSVTILSILIGFAEITPKKNRGSAMTLIGLFYVFGELLCCLIAYLTTDNLNFTSGNWRGLLIFSSFLALISFVLLLLWLDESPRFSLIKG